MRRPNLKRFALKRVLSLPQSALRIISGGAPVHLGGRTLDPKLQVITALAKRNAKPEAESVEGARQSLTALIKWLAPPAEKGVKRAERTIEGPRGEIPCRLYRPADQDPAAPVMVFAHLGAGVIGDLETCEAFCAILAAVSRGPVLSVGYRLAPEHKFPAGLEDVLASYHYVIDHAEDFGAPAGRAAIGGESIGGNFAAAICQSLRKRKQPQPELQLLINPVLDLASDTPSMSTYADVYPLTRATLNRYAGHYLGAGDAPADSAISPLRAKNFSALAPAIIAAAGFDPLLDQGETYGRALKAAKVPVIYRRYDRLSHAFTLYTGVSEAADGACREIAHLVREAYERGISP